MLSWSPKSLCLGSVACLIGLEPPKIELLRYDGEGFPAGVNDPADDGGGGPAGVVDGSKAPKSKPLDAL